MSNASRCVINIEAGNVLLEGYRHCTFGEHRFSTSGLKDSVMETVELGFITRSDFDSIVTVD